VCSIYTYCGTGCRGLGRTEETDFGDISSAAINLSFSLGLSLARRRLALSAPALPRRRCRVCNNGIRSYAVRRRQNNTSKEDTSYRCPGRARRRLFVITSTVPKPFSRHYRFDFRKTTVSPVYLYPCTVFVCRVEIRTFSSYGFGLTLADEPTTPIRNCFTMYNRIGRWSVQLHTIT